MVRLIFNPKNLLLLYGVLAILSSSFTHALAAPPVQRASVAQYHASSSQPQQQKKVRHEQLSKVRNRHHSARDGRSPSTPIAIATQTEAPVLLGTHSWTVEHG